eukprot:CAMPEP_0198655662 /NCGR_PEP_ID=MMETSP1467-20131203/8501_1 /TAXON_ID=1462469 /ORGANISM="unid. sp., Strain CCMP2135" /LENGTH=38 /DNA_ID= /DNA_START= /DNA_END= /DNA_ORIENTATION=
MGTFSPKSSAAIVLGSSDSARATVKLPAAAGLESSSNT